MAGGAADAKALWPEVEASTGWSNLILSQKSIRCQWIVGNADDVCMVVKKYFVPCFGHDCQNYYILTYALTCLI